MESTLDLPIAISLINGRYFLFSADVVSFLRREHHICGVLIGSIPQIPQQNIFLGLPLELMPEEARLLVEKDVAFVLDDVRAHEEGLQRIKQDNRQAYISSLQTEGTNAAKQQAGLKEQKRNQALKKRGLTPKFDGVETSINSHESSQTSDSITPQPSDNASDSLFTPPPEQPLRNTSPRPSPAPTPLAVTPATSSLLLPPTWPSTTDTTISQLPTTPPSYPLFAHLHSKGHFISPGLRFGCQYLVYPGDPLRFHSHFLAVGVDWDQEIDLMDIVGGGRLGTGVKKGYLFGGAEPEIEVERTERVRTFSVEWAGM